jgi:hypothetical protein
MSNKILNIVHDLDGDIYHQILAIGATHCALALLVVRKTIPLDASANDFLSRMQSYLASKTESMEWPGTTLLDDTAWVYQYRLTEGCIEGLKAGPASLYGWTQPSFPEDLCLLRDGGEPWLVSIAHEEDAYFQLSDEELVALLNEIPELRAITQLEPTGGDS